MTNLTQNLNETNSQVINEVLTNYFEMHSVEETEKALNDLLQAWLCPDESKRTRMGIANQVFFVHNISSLIRKVAARDLMAQDINSMTEPRLFLFNYFDQFGFDYPQDTLHMALQSWICPDDQSAMDLKLIADTVSFFEQLGKFIRACAQLEEGGAVCA